MGSPDLRNLQHLSKDTSFEGTDPAFAEADLANGCFVEPHPNGDRALAFAVLTPAVNLLNEILSQLLIESDASVLTLLEASRPPTVRLLVSAIVVAAFDGRIRWALAHVFEERRERRPAITHRDAATAVVRIRLRIRIRATLSHRLPRHTRRRWLRSKLSILVSVSSRHVTTRYPY